MIEVITKDKIGPVYTILPNGVHALPDEHGWISIIDEDGLTLAMFHKDQVIAVHFKAGETEMKVENPNRTPSA